MSEFRLKGDVTDEDFIIHIINNCHDVILAELETRLTYSGDDILTIEVICKKLNHWFEKIKNKNEEEKNKRPEETLMNSIKEYKKTKQ